MHNNASSTICLACGVLFFVIVFVLYNVVCFAGPVMTKFTIALREIGTYKEVLRSQVL